jgi:hypothetical protein
MERQYRLCQCPDEKGKHERSSGKGSPSLAQWHAAQTGASNTPQEWYEQQQQQDLRLLE